MTSLELRRFRHLHFVGIGGIGMSAIAKILHGHGFTITGSDMRESGNTIRLRDLGIKTFIGHDASNVRGVDLVVRSSAVSWENVELREAKARQIPIRERAELLEWIMAQSEFRVAIAGTHGKTTTTSMIAHMLTHLGKNPTFLIGGVANDVDYNARLGNGKIVVAEADESDGSFLKLSPTHSVITNIEADHLDHYGNMESVMDAFAQFVAKHPAQGALVVNIDHGNIVRLLADTSPPCRVLTYGYSEEATVQAVGCQFDETHTSYRLRLDGKEIDYVELSVPGRQNILNSLAAIAMGLLLTDDPMFLRDSLQSFRGARRRFQILGKAAGVTVIDDYAHHPTELRVTIEAAQLGWPKNHQLVVVFQPHRYTRTRDLVEEFASAFRQADRVIVTDIYSAGEKPIEGVTGERLFRAVQDSGHARVEYIPRKETIPEKLLPELQENDIVLFAGAGDINNTAKELYARLHDLDHHEKRHS